MTRETSQNADLDFEQMMGELAAMKTDLAHRQASRSGPRTTTPRTPGDGEPRRTRTRRTPAPSEPRPDLSLSVDAVPTENPLPVPAPLSPLSKQPDERDDHVNEIQSQNQSQNLSESRNQSQNMSESQNQNENQDHLKNLLGDTPSMAIDTANPVESRIRTVQTLDEPLTQPDQEPKGPELSGVTESPPESRRPLPPKSAQRSRSISHHSGRPSPSTHDDQAPDCSGSSTPSTPQEVITPTFGASAPRKFLRPHPSSPSLSTSNQSPASPRLPARSNSRRQPQAILPAVAPSEAQQPSSYGGGPPPVIPPRSRSGSRSLSRNNTITRPDGDQSNPFPTTTIAEDGEPSPQTPQNSSPQQPLHQLQPQQPQPESQQPQHEPMPESETRSPSASVSGPGHARKKSSSNGLRRLNEEDENNHSLAPSLLPAEPIPSNPPSHHNFQQQQQQHQSPQYHKNENAGRPTLRKQKSADPAAMYRQQEESSLTPGRLPSRHASERRPNRDKNNSSSGVSEPRDQQERGRTQSKEEGSKGGLFNWVRSRSKSKDASLARLNYDTSHPVPEQPSYTEYNPALIPSRSVSAVGGALRRDKSIPRKASNQNFHPSGDGAWPPYSPGGKSGDQDLPIQRKKSLSRPGPNGTIIPPTLHRMASNAALDGSGPGPQMSLNISTNSSTTYHENMIRGMGMGSTPITPTVLLTPQPSFPTTGTPAGNMRGMALNMMKEDDAKHHAQEQQQMQQQLERQQQLQQAQLQHLQQQQQKLAASVANSMTSPPGTPTRTAAPAGPLSPAPAPAPTVRLVATRIYIQTETDFKSVNLAPNTTALDVLHMLQQRGCFGEPGDGRYHDRWTIFEYSKEFLIERPLRDFEVVLDVIKTWEADKDNKMICKSFPARDELAAKEIVRLVGPAGQASFVRPHGWVHLEIKKSKWVKRYLHATDTAVYHSKDNKFNGESMLCLLRNFDVYAVQVPRKKAPTKFGFALKSSDKIHLFETPEDDYIHYVCTDSGESLREWLVGLRASKGIHMYHANPEVIREGQKHALELQSAESEGAMNSRGNLTEEQPSLKHPDSKSAQAASPISSNSSDSSTFVTNPDPVTSPGVSLDPDLLPSPTAPSPPGISPTKDSSNSVSSTSLSSPQLLSPPSLPQPQPQPPSTDIDMKLDAISSASSGHTPSHRQPFAAGSLLQQRAEAEKQEIENMKLQLRLREQAGVLGAKNFTSVDPPAGYYLHHPNGGLTGIAGSNSANPLSSMSSSSLLSQQPKFGGPGTLIEKGEARAAQLLVRSKSAGTGLLHPPANIGHNSYNRSRSKSRGPGEDRSGHYSGSSSPRSTGSASSSAASPNGPLLHFEDENAMIKPGLLLDRAKSAKQASMSGSNGYSRGYSSNGAQAGSRGRQASSNSNNTHSSNGRTRIKPLIDLGNVQTGQDLIGPGLLTAHSSRPAQSGAQSARSPRRNKPLLEF